MNVLAQLLDVKETELETVKDKFEDTVNDVEIERDVQIKAIKEAADQRVQQESMTTAKAIGTMTVAVQQFQATRQTLEELEARLADANKDKKILKQQVDCLQVEVLRAKAYVKERDVEISERQRELAELVTQAQEKDKFRAMLQNRLKQMEERDGPTQEYMHDLMAHINKLEKKNGELFVELRDNMTIRDTLKEKVEYLEKINNQQRLELLEKAHTMSITMTEIAVLAEAVPVDQYPQEIAKMYHKYVDLGLITPDPNLLKLIPKADDSQDKTVRELVRQRDFLIKAVEKEKQVVSKTEARALETRKESIAASNILVEDVNALRMENRKLKEELEDWRHRHLADEAACRNRERQFKRELETKFLTAAAAGALPSLLHQLQQQHKDVAPHHGRSGLKSPASLPAPVHSLPSGNKLTYVAPPNAGGAPAPSAYSTLPPSPLSAFKLPADMSQLHANVDQVLAEQDAALAAQHHLSVTHTPAAPVVSGTGNIARVSGSAGVSPRAAAPSTPVTIPSAALGQPNSTPWSSISAHSHVAQRPSSSYDRPHSGIGIHELRVSASAPVLPSLAPPNFEAVLTPTQIRFHTNTHKTLPTLVHKPGSHDPPFISTGESLPPAKLPGSPTEQLSAFGGSSFHVPTHADWAWGIPQPSSAVGYAWQPLGSPEGGQVDEVLSGGVSGQALTRITAPKILHARGPQPLSASATVPISLATRTGTRGAGSAGAAPRPSAMANSKPLPPKALGVRSSASAATLPQ